MVYATEAPCFSEHFHIEASHSGNIQSNVFDKTLGLNDLAPINFHMVRRTVADEMSALRVAGLKMSIPVAITACTE